MFQDSISQRDAYPFRGYLYPAQLGLGARARTLAALHREAQVGNPHGLHLKDPAIGNPIGNAW
jgi:hypothetical protein